MGNINETTSDIVDAADGILTHGVVNYYKIQQDYTDRLNALTMQKQYKLIALHNEPRISSWMPLHYPNSYNHKQYTPSIPGHVILESYGDCYIHASCTVPSCSGEGQQIIYLITIPNTILEDRSYINPKELKWYEAPSIFNSGKFLFPGFCKPIPCMIDLFDYQSSDPANSNITLRYSDNTSNIMSLSDLLGSKDTNIINAFINFKYAHKHWIVEKNIEHIVPTISSSSTDGSND